LQDEQHRFGLEADPGLSLVVERAVLDRERAAGTLGKGANPPCSESTASLARGDAGNLR
jgi:hypothetical protein